MPHILTVDTEDWPALLCMYLGAEIPATPHFAETTYQMLDLFDTHHAKATFFVVAKHAKDAPAVVREIVSRGHELASHGWTHRKMVRLRPEVFAEEVRRSVETLEDLAGVKVRGYRSPFFSLLPDQLWALEAQIEAGLEYDSSIATLLWKRAGVPISSQPFIFQLPNESRIMELPIPAKKWGPLTVRLIGGRGIRLVPRSVSIGHIRECEAQQKIGMMYLHSYELPGLPLTRDVPKTLGLKYWTIQASAFGFSLGLKRMKRIVEELLKFTHWSSAYEVLSNLRQQNLLFIHYWKNS